MNQSKEGLVRDKAPLHGFYTILGWIINWSKSVTEPTHKNEFSLPETKCKGIIQKRRDLLRSEKISIHNLASLIGTLNAILEALTPAAPYIRELQMHKTKNLLKSQNYKTIITLSPECKSEINLGVEHLQNWNGKSIISPTTDFIIEIDASSIHGWGAVDNTKSIKMGGSWNE